MSLAGDGNFAATRWSVVLAAGRNSLHAAPALEQLCRSYWRPLYAFARRRGLSPHDAEDATQAFFARLLERGAIGLADPARGRFRTFLLTSLRNFLENERGRAGAAKRGGGASVVELDAQDAETRYRLEPADARSPEAVFERQWAVTLLERVLVRLGAEYETRGQGSQFLVLKERLAAGSDGASFAETAGRLGISEAAARTAAHRLRRRYRDLLLEEIAQTVASPEEAEDELQHLFRALQPA